MSDEDDRDADFTEAWEHRDEHDVGADTSRFEAFRSDDTAELIRNQLHGEDDLDAPATADAGVDAPTGPDPDAPGSRPATVLVVGALAVLFVVVAVLYLLN